MKSAVVVTVAIVLATGVCWAQNASVSLDDRFRLEWELEQSKSGRPTITGYVYNSWHFGATDIQLLVEELDSSGRPVSKTVGYIDTDVESDGRAYFEIPVPSAGATYRVTMLSFDWVTGGPSGP